MRCTLRKSVTTALCGGLLTTLAAAQTESAKKTPIADRYRDKADRIMTAVLAGNDAYNKLEELCYDFGHRLSGSAELDRVLQWALVKLENDGQENVRLEPVTVPRWVRGAESLTMVKPRKENLPILGLGRSVGTPPEGITAEVVAVADEEALDALGDGAKGKIVLFNNPMPPYTPERGTSYGSTVRFRSKGARLSSEKGAVACLVRSVTATSFRSPHTGAMRYGDAKIKIPAAAVSTEDAQMLARMYERGHPATVTLEMEAKTHDPVMSGNVIGELRGSKLPEEVIVISGHIDAWDVGHGAHDDGGGCVAAMESINVLRRLNLIPRRTIRVVLWTNEENGLAGGREYAKVHADELADTIAAIESDGGTFRPTGYSVECEDKERENLAVSQMTDILSLFASMGATNVTTGHSGADLGPMRSGGVVLMGHRVDSSHYFDYHHSHADTLDKVDPTELSQNVAVMATVAYILADMPERFASAAAR